MADINYGINQYRYENNTNNYLTPIGCNLDYIQLNSSNYQDIKITPQNDNTFFDSGSYYLEFKVPRNKIYDINLDLKLMYKDSSNVLSGLNENRYQQIQRLLIPRTSSVDNITTVIYKTGNGKVQSGILRDKTDCEIFDVYREPGSYYVLKSIDGNTYGAIYDKSQLELNGNNYKINSEETYTYNEFSIIYSKWKINGKEYTEQEWKKDTNNNIIVTEKHPLSDLTLKKYYIEDKDLNNEDTTIECSPNQVSFDSQEASNFKYKVSIELSKENVELVYKTVPAEENSTSTEEGSTDQTQETTPNQENEESTSTSEENRELDYYKITIGNSVLKATPEEITEENEKYIFKRAYEESSITKKYSYITVRNNIKIETDQVNLMENDPENQYEVRITYSEEQANREKTSSRIYKVIVEESNNNLPQINNGNFYLANEVIEMAGAVNVTGEDNIINEMGESIVDRIILKTDLSYDPMSVTINYDYFYKNDQASFTKIPIENLVTRDILANFLAEDTSNDEQYYSVKVVFSPKVEIKFNSIVLEIVRKSYDEDISYTANSSRIYKGLRLDIEKIISNFHLYKITELVGTTSAFKIPHSPLTHIGIWGHPELMLAINGEHIQIGQSGFYELDDYHIDSLGVVAKDNNDKFVIDYQYEID